LERKHKVGDMNFAHSFWSVPLAKCYFGDLEEKFVQTLVFYATSVSCVHRSGHKITLYTDKDGAEILSGIPYDDVVILENTITSSPKFAASFKFLALEKMPLGDVLIDGDLYLYKDEVIRLLESCNEDVVVTCFENACDIREGLIKSLRKGFTQLEDKSYYSLNKFIDGYHNTSLIRFNNAELRDKWIEQYKIYAERYKDIEFDKCWPDIIIEQRHLTDLCRNENYSIKSLFGKEGVPIDNDYASQVGFIHIGSAKKDMIIPSFALLEKYDKQLLNKIYNAIKNIISL
jgi:hypothetical protein